MGASHLFCWLALHGDSACPQSSQSASCPHSSCRASRRLQCGDGGISPWNHDKRSQLQALILVKETFSLRTRRPFYDTLLFRSEVPKVTKSRLVLCELTPLSILPRIFPETQRQVLPPRRLVLLAIQCCMCQAQEVLRASSSSSVFCLSCLAVLRQELSSKVSYNHPQLPFRGQGCCLAGGSICGHITAHMHVHESAPE